MNQNKLFQLTRIRLALWYAIAMALILSLCGFGVYKKAIIMYVFSIEYYALIEIQDTGIGIPQQEMPRIFDRFYRVNSDRPRSTGGSGLGLAIVQALLGNIQVQSQLGCGSTFIVLLPLEVTGSPPI